MRPLRQSRQPRYGWFFFSGLPGREQDKAVEMLRQICCTQLIPIGYQDDCIYIVLTWP